MITDKYKKKNNINVLGKIIIIFVVYSNPESPIIYCIRSFIDCFNLFIY